MFGLSAASMVTAEESSAFSADSGDSTPPAEEEDADLRTFGRLFPSYSYGLSQNSYRPQGYAYRPVPSRYSVYNGFRPYHGSGFNNYNMYNSYNRPSNYYNFGYGYPRPSYVAYSTHSYGLNSNYGYNNNNYNSGYGMGYRGGSTASSVSIEPIGDSSDSIKFVQWKLLIFWLNFVCLKKSNGSFVFRMFDQLTCPLSQKYIKTFSCEFTVLNLIYF